jgi:hypothetical protein
MVLLFGVLYALYFRIKHDKQTANAHTKLKHPTLLQKSPIFENKHRAKPYLPTIVALYPPARTAGGDASAPSK